MNKDKIEISLNQEDVQNIIDCYEKDIKYIERLEKENTQLKSVIKEIREYIITTTNRNKELNCTGLLAENQVKDLLQILDKGDK